MLNNFLFDQQSVNRLIVGALALMSKLKWKLKKFPGDGSVGQYNKNIP